MAALQCLLAAITTITSLSPPFFHLILSVVTFVAPIVCSPAPPRVQEEMDALHVSTRRQLEDIFQQLVPLFEGNETEQNWTLRENAVKKLQRLTWGDAPHRFPKVYVAGIKTLLDGILKTVNSLRTTLSTNGCKLVQDIAVSAGSGWTGGLDPSMIDILLQNLIKLCCNTKNLAAENGNTTVTAILANVPFSARLLHHIWQACEHKSEKPRTYAPGWLNTIFTKHGHHKNILEHAGGIELIEKCIKKGLGDANPGVREGMRGTFWTYAQLWPERSQVIMSALDAKQQSLLTKHPANPDPNPESPVIYTKPARSALKDTIAAHKRAKATGKDLPLRPRSAQPTDNQSVNNQPINDQPVNKKPVNNQPINDQPVNNKSVNNQTINDQPVNNKPVNNKPVLPTPQDVITPKETGDDLPIGPQSAQPASVEEDTSLDDLFIEKPEQSSLDNAQQLNPKPQQKQDSIFGAKRAKEAEQNPQQEHLPKDVKRLLVGPRRRPRKPVVKSAEDVCFIKPKKNRAKVEAEKADVRVRPRPVLDSPKPVRVDSSHWGWRKCLFKGETQRALTGRLSQRLDLDDNSLATIKLEDDLEIAIDMCKTLEAIFALLEYLEAEAWPIKENGKNNVDGLKSTALYMLAYLLRRQLRETKDGKQAFTDNQALPLAKLVQKGMRSDSIQVRTATIEYCRDLYATTTTSQFWQLSEGDPDLEALIWYHLMKNNKKTDEKGE